MAAIVCHGLQSCLESQLVESRTLRLTFPFPKPQTPPQNPIDLPFKASFWDSNTKTHRKEMQNKADTTSTGWSFLQALSNVSHGPKDPSDKENAYVHPQAKRSSVLMSQKSLELCTEKLGNETGSDIVENNGYDVELLCPSPTGEQGRLRQGCLGGRKTRTHNFPPPLTTMRGSESLRVRSHREDGRLVIEAFRVPPRASCFQAERKHGRLRLCFLKDCNFDPEDKQPSNDNEGVEDECECETEEKVEEAEDDKEGEEEEETGEEGGDVEDGERDMRKGKHERPRRCKKGGEHESNELLNNWGEPLWVAIS